ncbi:DUF4272 domain-containing protein [Gloeobacter kilaueensis]|uniref:DUF4272 domain-containing protein n=1 Tax=Gloeobacter kilaueensis (strain ATCC BAA-2537 / CCAP 1431/1 / ULC 316 / JS1) TaxID=1183438 RepID=U5QJ63_GLOK1|nr:DUF4272 domain-containing protein [Gloeobacter kilaueensis]AGY58898.1 hypothetical protein GKIL_2652 [Gloeobacter kilaueensis JS1]
MITFSPGQFRKLRSETFLRSSGIPVNPVLPVLPDERTVRLQPASAVAERSLVLFGVAARAEGLEQEAAIRFLEERRLWGAATREEQIFLLDPEPAEQDVLQFIWRYESLWVLLWALGYVEELALPRAICDIAAIVGLITSVSVDPFVDFALLRPLSDILDQADLTYRYHWAALDARLRGYEPPAGLDTSIVYERHYTFNWLTRRHDQEWDDISTEL